jgi:hypothetical protein
MDQVIVPSPQGSEAYVELARTRQAKGRVFRKHILNLGELIHPKTGERLTLDDAWYGRMKANFDSGVCDIVQVPLANDKNEHSEDPLRNAGEVIGVEREGSKVYSVIDVRDPDIAERIADKRILGASAFLSLDYTDTSSGDKAGPALLHHCLTNRPYVTGLDDYEEVIAASADGTGDVIVLAQEAPRMTKEELLAQLKAEHGIDVEALEAQAGQRADMSQLTAMLTEALKPAAGTVSLTGGTGEEVSLTDVVGAVAELAEKNVSLSGTVGDLQKDAAGREVDDYIRVGRLLPKTRKHAVKLVLSGDREGLDDILAPEKEPYVRLNNVEGAAPPQGEQRHLEDIDGEIARLTGQPATSQFFTPNGATKK